MNRTLFIWIAILAMCSYFYTATTSIFTLVWIVSSVYDTLRALRSKYPNGRTVGEKTRARAQRDVLPNWVIFMIAHYIGQARLDRLVSWIPFYTSCKVIVMGFFLYERSSITQTLFHTYLRKYLSPYEETVDSIMDFFAKGIAVVLHFSFEKPVNAIIATIKRPFARSTKANVPSNEMEMILPDRSLMFIDKDTENFRMVKPMTTTTPLKSAIARPGGQPTKISPVRFARVAELHDVAEFENDSPPSQATTKLPSVGTHYPRLEHHRRSASPASDSGSETGSDSESESTITLHAPLSGSPVSRKRTRAAESDSDSDGDYQYESSSDDEEPVRSRPRTAGPTSSSAPAAPVQDVTSAPTSIIAPFVRRTAPSPTGGNAARHQRIESHRPYPKTSPRRGLGPHATIFAPNALEVPRPADAPRRIPTAASVTVVPVAAERRAEAHAAITAGLLVAATVTTTAGRTRSRPAIAVPTSRRLARSTTTTSLAGAPLGDKAPNRPTAIAVAPVSDAPKDKGQAPVRPTTSRYQAQTRSTLAKSNTLAAIPAAAAGQENRDRGRSSAPSPPPSSLPAKGPTAEDKAAVDKALTFLRPPPYSTNTTKAPAGAPAPAPIAPVAAGAVAATPAPVAPLAPVVPAPAAQIGQPIISRPVNKRLLEVRREWSAPDRRKPAPKKAAPAPRVLVFQDHGPIAGSSSSSVAASSSAAGPSTAGPSTSAGIADPPTMQTGRAKRKAEDIGVVDHPARPDSGLDKIPRPAGHLF